MRVRSISIFALVVLATGGCGLQPETLESLRDAVQTASHSPQHRQAAETPSDNRQFDPPNPDRIDPFTFAITSANDVGSTSVRTAVQVDVLGFAHVNEPRALLRIKDSTHSMKVGDLADGVEVIGISPPAVDLRMGGLQWRATMFDRPSGN